MADNEQTQANQAASPVKKRRFYKPRPKVKPEAIKTINANKEQAQEQMPQASAKAAAKPQPKAKARPIAKARPTAKTQPAAKLQPKSAPAAIQTQAKPQTNKEHKPKVFTKKAAQTVPQKPEGKQSKPATTQAHSVKSAGPRALAPKPLFKRVKSFKPAAAQGVRKGHLSDINFKYLDRPQFQDIYALVMKAQSYFASDKETCCAKFRLANEAIITRLIKDLRLDAVVEKRGIQTNFFEQINLLQKEIPAEMVDSNIFAEMHNIRMIGNSFVHGDDKYSADRGSKTCLIAMEKLCRWLVDFEPKYLSYQRAKDLTKSNPLQDIWNGIKSLFKF